MPLWCYLVSRFPESLYVPFPHCKNLNTLSKSSFSFSALSLRLLFDQSSLPLSVIAGPNQGRLGGSVVLPCVQLSREESGRTYFLEWRKDGLERPVIAGYRYDFLIKVLWLFKSMLQYVLYLPKPATKFCRDKRFCFKYLIVFGYFDANFVICIPGKNGTSTVLQNPFKRKFFVYLTCLKT